MGAIMMYAFVITAGIYYWRKDRMSDTHNES